MVSPNAVRFYLGIIGNIISFGLFLSPVPTFVDILKKKSVQEYSAWPYLGTIINCLFWMLYGLPVTHPNNILVTTINSIGLAIEVVYITIYIVYAYWPKRRMILGVLVGEAVLFVIVLLVTLFAFHSTDKRTIFVGAFCVVFNICMYWSPLTITGTVLRTKSVEFMPFNLTLACFLNGACWTAYACLGKIDYWMVVPNGLGTLSGIIQLALYGMFFNSTKKIIAARHSQVELPSKTLEV